MTRSAATRVTTGIAVLLGVLTLPFPDTQPKRAWAAGVTMVHAPGEVVPAAAVRAMRTKPTVGPGRTDGVIVAVLDSGIRTNHPWFVGRLLTGRSFVEPEPAIEDRNGHGTHVAGIIAQVNPDATILPVKVLDEEGNGSDWYVAQGIRWAIEQGARVINLSLSAAGQSHNISLAVEEAIAADAVVVAAGGNDGLERIESWPAGHPSAIAVANITKKLRAEESSTRAEYLDIAAPGSVIESAGLTTGTTYMTGTSMAAPHVAAVAARLRALYPTWTESEIRNHLQATARDIGNPGHDPIYGWGALDAERAVNTPGPAAQVSAASASIENTYTFEPIKNGTRITPDNPHIHAVMVESEQQNGLSTRALPGKGWRALHDSTGLHTLTGLDVDGTPIMEETADLGKPARYQIRVERRNGRLQFKANRGTAKRLAIWSLTGKEFTYEEMRLPTRTGWQRFPGLIRGRYRICYIGPSGDPFGCSKTTGGR